MTRRRRTSDPVPHHPNHRRDWRTLWRRCICGLPAPCIDRFPPSPPPPYPRRTYIAPEQRIQGSGGLYRSRHASPGAGASPDSGSAEIPARTTHPDSNVGRAGRLTPAQEHRANEGARPPSQRRHRSH
jgi:hypothetical protein